MEAVPQPPQQHGGAHVAAAPPPPAPRRVSAEAFLQGTTIAWGHLQLAERRAIRACCRAGRLQHDRLLAKLRVVLRDGAPPSSGPDPNRAPPPPSQLRTSLQGVVGRGARPQSLFMYFVERCNRQNEANLLAALEACSSCPLVDLRLEGAVPLSGAVAEAVEACCPQLARLTLDHQISSRPVREALRGEAASEYHYGCVQLLTLCGPRLRELRLRGVQCWQPMSYMALRRCTALVTLELEVGRKVVLGLRVEDERHGDDPDVDARLFGQVSHLKTLQALHLVLDGDPNACTPDAVRPHATCVARLSALTGLTRLGLVLSSCYEHDGDSYRRHVEDGEQHGAWVEVREAHRTSLLSALRCMPQLLQLYCPTQWLRLSELPPSLTALTSLTLGGILPPPAEEGPGGLAGGGGLPARRAAGAPLPPQLRELVLKVGASPRALAQLQPPPSLVHLHMHALRFGISDVEDGKLRPEAVAAVGPAVRTLLACRHPTRGPSHIRISGDGGAGQLLPREGSPNGHMEWIQQLRGLQAIRNLTLVGVRLRPADLCCLGQALSSLQGLGLRGCLFPLAALPGLRPHMTHLTVLDVDLGCHNSIDADTLMSVALLLARPHPGAAQLQHLTFDECPHDVDIGLCEQSVMQQLEDDFGVTGAFVALGY